MEGRTATGIVLFHPDPDLLACTLRTVCGDGAAVYLFLNSPLSPDISRCIAPHAGPDLVLLNDGRNLGLGAAYNRLAHAATQAGCASLLLLDQDSSPPPGMADALAATRRALRRAGTEPAVVGPRPVAVTGTDAKPPRLFAHAPVPTVHPASGPGARPLEFVVSSGSLIDLAAFAAVGEFREDFFIDAIDIEWCFRAWSKGFSCWMVPDLAMPHRFGQGVIRVPVLGMRLVRQPAFRLYTYVRNQMAMLGLRHVPTRWKLRLVPYLALQTLIYLAVSRGDREMASAFALGVIDGLRHRMGPAPPACGRSEPVWHNKTAPFP